MQCLGAGAVEAADVAAPVEGAVAPLRHLLCPGLVTSTTAKEFAPVQPRRRAIAGPARRDVRGRLASVRAEVGRLLKVDQVAGRGWLVRRVLRLQVARFSTVRGTVAALVGIDHAGGAVEAVLEEVADRAETGQPHPAGADGAGAGHPVALTLLPHLRGHRLQQKKGGGKEGGGGEKRGLSPMSPG